MATATTLSRSVASIATYAAGRSAATSDGGSDDHLSLVAGITQIQIEELKRHGVDTVAALAAMPLPLTWKPSRGTAPSYERIREQARIQIAGRNTGKS